MDRSFDVLQSCKAGRRVFLYWTSRGTLGFVLSCNVILTRKKRKRKPERKSFAIADMHVCNAIVNLTNLTLEPNWIFGSDWFISWNFLTCVGAHDQFWSVCWCRIIGGDELDLTWLDSGLFVIWNIKLLNPCAIECFDWKIWSALLHNVILGFRAKQHYAVHIPVKILILKRENRRWNFTTLWWKLVRFGPVEVAFGGLW